MISIILLSIGLLLVASAVVLTSRRLAQHRDLLEQTVDSFYIVRQGYMRIRDEQEPVLMSLRMHSAQLKGAGERIRKLEAELAAHVKTLESIIKQTRVSR